LLIIGLFSGVLAGLFGIGGGVVFVPVLLVVLPIIGVESSVVTVSAVATSLFAGSFASGSSLFNHKRKNNILIKEGLIFGLGAFISASIIPNVIVLINPEILKIVISVFIFIVALNLMFSSPKPTISEKKLNPNWLFPIGIFLGAIASMSGLGGGIFYVPVLYYFLNGDLKLSVGTSTIVIFITMISSTISFAFLSNNWNSETFQFGYLNVASALLLGIGAIIGAYFGVNLIFKVPVSNFRKIFSVFLIMVVIKILLGVKI
jgi:uncharacterized membrane protein YfcA